MMLNSDDQDADYTTFGKIVLFWGDVESHLTNIVLRLAHPRFGLFPKFKAVPKAFRTVIDMARQGYTQTSLMSPLASDALPLLDRLMPLHDKRSIIVHGRFQGRIRTNYAFGIYRAGRFKFEYFSDQEVRKLEAEIVSSRFALEQLSRRTFDVSFPPLSQSL
jgi:hypothetical protein